MKVLHVETGRFLYGGPQQVLYLVKALGARGLTNVVVAPKSSAIDAACRDQGLTVINLPCGGDHDIRFGFLLARLLRKEKPDIVHCHSRRGGDVFGGRAAAAVNIPVVVSRRVDNPERRWIAAFRYRPFNRVIAISGAIAAVLNDAGVDPARITVIRDAVDTDRFRNRPDAARMRRKFGLASDSFVIACVAQLIARKGHRFLFQAVAGLRRAHPNLKLLVFGRGPLEGELRALAAQLELGDSVLFAGFQEDLDDYLGSFDLLVHPALREGLGVAALKAAAARVPVVGFAAGGLIESVQHESTGLLVPPGDAGALGRAIAQIIESPDLRRRFGEAGRRRMEREFSIDRMTDGHTRLYDAVIQSVS